MKNYILVIIFLTIFLLEASFSIKGKSVTADEPAHLSYGEQILKKHIFQRISNSKMPISTLNAFPSFIIEKLGFNLPDKLKLFISRFPTIILGIILGYYIFLWAKEIYNIKAGYLALFLYIFCPNIIAHSSLITTDIPVTAFILFSSYSYWKYLNNPSKKQLLITGFLFGIAQLSKYTALHLIPIFIIITLYKTILEKERLKLKNFFPLIIIFIAALVVINIGCLFEGSFKAFKDSQLYFADLAVKLANTPFIKDIPIPLPYSYWEGIFWVMHDDKQGHPSFLMGNYSLKGWWYYFLIAFLIKVPLTTLILFTMSFILNIKEKFWNNFNEIFLIIPISYLFIYFSFFFHTDIGIRFILPIFPFVFILSSKIINYIKLEKVAFRLLFTILILFLPYSSLSVFPHYLAYFNEIIGGPKNGYKYLGDSNLEWGQDDELVNEFVKNSKENYIVNPEKPVSGNIIVSATFLQGISSFGKDNSIWLRNNFNPIDFIGYSWLIYKIPELYVLEDNKFSIIFKGLLNIEQDDYYIVSLLSGGNSELYIDGKILFNTALLGPGEYQGNYRFSCRNYPILLTYKSNERYSNYIKLVIHPSYKDKPIPISLTGYYYEGQELNKLRAIYTSNSLDINFGKLPPWWLKDDPNLKIIW